MTDQTDLIARLRSLEISGYPAHGSGFVTIVSQYTPGGQLVSDCQEAATALEALARENEALKADNAMLYAKACEDVWQPIETAPEGKKIFVCWYNRLGKWRTTLAAYYSEGTLSGDDAWDETSEDGFAPPGWYEHTEEHEQFLRLEYKPIAWQPLPAPPDGGEGG